MSHIEKTAADKKALGFDFQDFVFVYNILFLEKGESISLEVLDDIHIETIKEIILIQVKHSVHSGNLTDRDIDLWKTLWNWFKSYPELPKTKKLRYILYTNKGLGSQDFITALTQSQINKEKIKDYVQKAYQALLAKENEKDPESAANPIFKYVKELAADTSGTLDTILDNLEIHSDTTEITKKIDDRLSFFSIPLDRIASTRNELLGLFDVFKYNVVKSLKKITIDFDTFRNDIGFDRILHLACTTEVDFGIYYDRYRELDISTLSFEHSVFGEQLHDLGLSKKEIIDHGIEMVTSENVLDELNKKGKFSLIEYTRITTQASSHWQRVHNRAHRHSPENEDQHREFATKCYEDSIEKQLISNKQTLPEEICRGRFMKLSDALSIGWRNDWETKYKK